MKLKNAIIAEVGSVHDGSFGNACRLIDAATQCGATAVKFQTHLAEHESLPCAPSPEYFKTESRMDYFNRTGFNEKEWGQLLQHCKNNGVDFLSSPFSFEAVDLLEGIGVSAYKIASGEVSNLPLIEKIASTGKPVLLSSGMSNWKELNSAVSILRPTVPLVIMQCSSLYPCPPEKIGLNILHDLKEDYACYGIGFSDHSEGYTAAIMAIAKGVTVIEKHFTFSKLMYGSDAVHSMEPPEFKVFASMLKDAWTMVGNPVDKSNIEEYKDMKRIFEKSIVLSRNIKGGSILQLGDLSFKKPGDGILASQYKKIVGKKVNKNLFLDCQLKWEDLS